MSENDNQQIRNDQKTSSQSEEDNNHRQLFCYDTLCTTKNDNCGSSIDLVESIAPDRNLEIVEVINEIIHLHDELMNNNERNNDREGLLAYFIYDEAAESTPSLPS